MTSVLDPSFPSEVAAKGEFDAHACMNCGVCTAVCPLELEVLPRKLLHLVVLGSREAVEEQLEAVYSCLLCRMCEASCPAGVHITANVRALRSYFNHHVLRI